MIAVGRWLRPGLALIAGLVGPMIFAGVPARPNMIFVLADDLGYGDIGAFGQTRIRTPHLDRMAREGAVFTHFYPGAAVCAPTRSCLMTGQHTGHTRVRGNRGSAGLERVPLRPEDVTVAEVLKGAGYRTALIGKWGLGEAGTTGIPRRQGFDYFLGYLNQDHAAVYYPETLWRNEEELVIAANADGRKGEFSNDRFCEEALAFISEDRGAPFFLYLAFTIPHAVWEVPDDSLQEYAGAFPGDFPVDDPEVLTRTPRAMYAAMVTRLDRYLGRLFARLQELGLDENTIVCFASDNGPAETAGLHAFFDSNGPLKGLKGTLYEGGIRAPMIVRWPGRVRAGAVSDYPWAGWDFLPTAAALAQIEPPSGIDGISVAPALLGQSVPARRAPMYWETHAKGVFSQAIRIGSRKALRIGQTAPIAVYDLAEDPGEMQDISSQDPGFVREAETHFRTDRTPSADWPVPPVKQ